MEHVDAVCCLPVRLARSAGELDALAREHGEPSELVPHADQAGVEGDLAGQGADCDERGIPHDQQRGYGLEEELWRDVGCLVQQQQIASSPLRGSDLRSKNGQKRNLNSFESNSCFRALKH